jgi:hypothetical protein
VNAERWKRALDVFDEAIERADESRSEFLLAACGDDRELRDRVERLLTIEREEREFLEHPAAEHLIDALAQPDAEPPHAHRSQTSARVQWPPRVVRRAM